MKLDDAHKFIDNCGTFVKEQLQELSNPVDGGNLSVYHALVLDSVACMFVDLIQGIDSIQVERDALQNGVWSRLKMLQLLGMAKTICRTNVKRQSF
jgi:hypothetical protein